MFFLGSVVCYACLTKAKSFDQFYLQTKESVNCIKSDTQTKKCAILHVTDEREWGNICGNICLSIYLFYQFTGIPVTIYSTLELSNRVVVLALTTQNLRDNPDSAVEWNQSSPGCHFWPRNGKIKKRKNDQGGTQANRNPILDISKCCCDLEN